MNGTPAGHQRSGAQEQHDGAVAAGHGSLTYTHTRGTFRAHSFARQDTDTERGFLASRQHSPNLRLWLCWSAPGVAATKSKTSTMAVSSSKPTRSISPACLTGLCPRAADAASHARSDGVGWRGRRDSDSFPTQTRSPHGFIRRVTKRTQVRMVSLMGPKKSATAPVAGQVQVYGQCECQCKCQC